MERNIDVLKDEIETLNEELRRSDDPAAQKSIKGLIDLRESWIAEAEAIADFNKACTDALKEDESTIRLAAIPHRLKTCSECGSLIDAAEIGEEVDIFVCVDCDATIIYPPATTRGACPYVFRCSKCGALTEYEAGRYSCNNSDCENFNRMKRPEDIDFGEYYCNPLTGYVPEGE